MVDPIAGKPIAGGGAVAGVKTPVALDQPVAPVAATPAAPPILADLAQTSGVGRELAASPPVDIDRVATIKKAIAEGRFPITPATIADRLIALKLQWHPDDGGRHDSQP